MTLPPEFLQQLATVETVDIISDNALTHTRMVVDDDSLAPPPLSHIKVRQRSPRAKRPRRKLSSIQEEILGNLLTDVLDVCSKRNVLDMCSKRNVLDVCSKRNVLPRIPAAGVKASTWDGCRCSPLPPTMPLRSSSPFTTALTG